SVRTSSKPSSRRCVATSAAVRTSRLPSSGCACRSRRHAISCGSTWATAASISAAIRFTAMRSAGTASPGARGGLSPRAAAAALARAQADEADAGVDALAASRLGGELGAALERHLDVDERCVVGARGEQIGGDRGRAGPLALEAELVEDAGEGIGDVVAIVHD